MGSFAWRFDSIQDHPSLHHHLGIPERVAAITLASSQQSLVRLDPRPERKLVAVKSLRPKLRSVFFKLARKLLEPSQTRAEILFIDRATDASIKARHHLVEQFFSAEDHAMVEQGEEREEDVVL
jgi:hypothetical protein